MTATPPQRPRLGEQSLIAAAVLVWASLATSSALADIASDLVLHYNFDETSGSVALDSSGHNTHATLFNFPSDNSMWVPGRVGNALQFNALDTDNDHFVLTDSPLNLSNFDHYTFAFWAKRRSDNNPFNPRFIGPVKPFESEHWVLWRPGFGVGFWEPHPSPEPVRDIWQHFVVTYDRPAGRYELFVDGELRVSATGYVRTAPAPDDQWVLGHKELLDDHRDPWRGYFDDFRVYNRVLSAGDVAELFDAAGKLAPTFDTHPIGQELFAGEAIRLSAAVDGSPPMTYQWYRGADPIEGATDLVLVITQAQTTDAGDYTLVAENDLGATTSTVASIAVKAVTQVTDALVGYWKFDETSGSTAADSSGQNHPGTVYNSQGDGGRWTSGQVGGALTFRGPDLGGDYVVVPNWTKAVNGTMTLSAWVWAEARPDRARIACGGSGVDGIGQFLFTQSAGGNDLRGYVQNSARGTTDARENVPFPTNSWQHVVLVADGALCRVYRNGAQVTSVAYNGTLFNPDQALSIGVRLTADDAATESGWWQGKIDDVAYWTRGLTSNEIVALFAAGLDGQDVSQVDASQAVAPIITAQPQGGSYVVGNRLSLSVQASATTPLSYQWRRDGVEVAHATNATYSIDYAQAANAGAYTVVLSNPAGSMTSESAVVVVNDPPPNLTGGLVLHLEFDETSGTTAADASDNNNHGTLYNFPEDNPIWVPGVIGNALLFNQEGSGDNDQVFTDQAVVFANQNEFSFAFWAKRLDPYGPIANPRLISPSGANPGDGDHWILWRPGFGVGIWDQVPVTVEPSGDRWHHFAVIFNRAAGSYDVYVDGTRRADGVPGAKAEPGAGPWIIGHHENWENSGNESFRGLLDDVRIYNRLITPREVSELYNLGGIVPPDVSLSISRVGSDVLISWPANLSGFALEVSDQLPAGSWDTVPVPAGQPSVQLPLADGPAYYRLRW